MSIQEKLKKFPVPDFVWEEYHLDQEINDRGLLLIWRWWRMPSLFDAKIKAELAEKNAEID